MHITILHYHIRIVPYYDIIILGNKTALILIVIASMIFYQATELLYIQYSKAGKGLENIRSDE